MFFEQNHESCHPVKGSDSQILSAGDGKSGQNVNEQSWVVNSLCSHLFEARLRCIRPWRIILVVISKCTLSIKTKTLAFRVRLR
jgi:hypothetical protein